MSRNVSQPIESQEEEPTGSSWSCVQAQAIPNKIRIKGPCNFLVFLDPQVSSPQQVLSLVQSQYGCRSQDSGR